jgi:bifunctional DNA primase/polymerase-like protein
MIAPATLAGLALAHASHGRPVAPICPPDDHGNCRFPACGKIENNVLVPHAPKEVGKAPIGRLVPHGIGSATTSTPTITRWWEAQPDANVGIELWASDLLVVDPDSHETEVAAISNGLDGGVIRDSRN